MSSKTVKKSFSVPLFIAKRLDELSSNTGISQSNHVYQALGTYLHRCDRLGTLEYWLECGGKRQGADDLLDSH